MTWFLDAHIHLSDPHYSPSITSTLKSLDSLAIKVCCVSTDMDTSRSTLSIAKDNKNIIPFIGIHPENKTQNIDQAKEFILENINKISGIGEIGLDGTFEDHVSRQQIDLFTMQMEIAEKYKLPVSVHSRKALPEIIELTKSFNTKILIHWFDGNKRQLKQIMDLGYFTSFGPVMVYSKDKQILLSKANEQQILVETDGPVKFSRCFEGRPAEIEFLPSVVNCVANILGKDFNQTLEMLQENAKKYLNLDF